MRLSVLATIEAQRDTFSAKEQRIAALLADAPERALRVSSAELAVAAGCSQSSVVKFCQKLGLSGYKALRAEIARLSPSERLDHVVHGTIGAEDDLDLTARKLIASKLHAMEETLRVNDGDRLDAARDAILSARRIHLTGVGASSLVARDFGYKLQKLDLAVLRDADSHIQMASAASAHPSDVLIALSHSGQSVETLRIAEAVAARGGCIVSITGLGRNALSRLATIALHTVADEERVRSSAITSRDAQLMIADLLFLRIVQTYPDAAELIGAAAHAITPLKL